MNDHVTVTFGASTETRTIERSVIEALAGVNGHDCFTDKQRNTWHEPAPTDPRDWDERLRRIVALMPAKKMKRRA